MMKLSKKQWIVVGGLLALVLILWTGRGFFNSQQQPSYTYWEPALSPDGSLLAYESSTEASLELFTLDLSTQVETQLTNNEVADWSPAWSPDGKQIVFSSSREGNVDIYLLDLVGLETTRLTTHEGDDINPNWGSDGSIYFNSNRSDSWEAYAIDPQSFILRKLTSLDTSTP